MLLVAAAALTLCFLAPSNIEPTKELDLKWAQDRLLGARVHHAYLSGINDGMTICSKLYKREITADEAENMPDAMWKSFLLSDTNLFKQ